MGQLGYNSGMYICSPVKVSIDQIKYISCGPTHTAMVSYDDQVLGCGSNKHKQLGSESVPNNYTIRKLS